MPEFVLTVVIGGVAAALASVVDTFLGTCLTRWRRKATISVGMLRITIDLSDPHNIPAVLDAYREAPRVFIAYAKEDRDFVDRLSEDLLGLGFRIWNYVVEVKPGDNLHRKIREGLSTSGYVIAVLSEASLNSKWVMEEMETALNREQKGLWPKVIPVIIDEVSPPTFLRDKVYVDLRGRYEEGLASVVDVMQGRRSRNGPSEC